MYSWQITLDALLYIIDTKVNDPSSGFYDCSRKYSCNLRLACDLIFFYVGCKSQRFHNIRSYINLTTKNIFLYDKNLTS